MCEWALNLYNTNNLALFRQFSAGLFGTKNTNGRLHMCRRPSVLKQGARWDEGDMGFLPFC